MDLDERDEDRAFRAGARSWLLANLPEGWDPNGSRTATMPERLQWFGRDWERRLLDAGLNGISWPKEYGGQGGPLAHEMILVEETARCNVPESINNVAKTMLGPTLLAHGTDDQRRRFLPGILDGRHIWCQGFSEPDAGSDLAGVRTRAERVTGGWRLHGQKLWTSRAQYSDCCFALVRSEPESTRHAGLSLVLVDLHQPGVEIRPLRQANGDDEFNEVWFEGAHVPDEDVLGSPSDGWNVARTILSFERGTAHFGRHIRFRRQLDDLMALARRLEVGGRPAAVDGEIRQRLAAALAEVEIYRLLVRRELAAVVDDGVGSGGSSVKLFWTAMWQHHQTLALDLLGPYADTLDGPGAVDGDERLLRYFSALSRTIAGGTSEIQRTLVAERVLRLPRARA